MQCKRRHQRPGQAAESNVLNNQGIHPGPFSGDQQIGGPLQLIAEHQDIEGEKTANLSAVEPIHQLGQILDPEIFSPLTGVEGLNPEIDRIRPGCNSSTHRLPIAGGSQQLRTHQEDR